MTPTLYAAGIIGFVLGLSAGIAYAAQLVRLTNDRWAAMMDRSLNRTTSLVIGGEERLVSDIVAVREMQEAAE